MGTYLLNFIVYSMAMVGLLFIGLVVYKKTMVNAKCLKKNDELNIENALNLSQRKTLYVIKVGNEKFLIAADTERTSFLAKLEDSEKSEVIHPNQVVMPNIMTNVSTNQQVLPKTQNNIKTEEKQVTVDVKPVDYSEVMAALKSKKSFSSEMKNSSKNSVMKEMARKISQPIFNDEE